MRLYADANNVRGPIAHVPWPTYLSSGSRHLHRTISPPYSPPLQITLLHGLLQQQHLPAVHVAGVAADVLAGADALLSVAGDAGLLVRQPALPLLPPEAV